MVGVPGRSKGCGTCRKRKIGCSRERPICSQCKSSSRECLGYGRQTIFLHNNKQYTIQEPRAVDRSDLAEAPFLDLTGSPPQRADETAVPFRNEEPLFFDRNPLEDHAVLDGPEHARSLIQSYTRKQILSPFFEMASKTAVPLGSGKTWTLLVADMPQPEKCLDTAVLALATARMGREIGEELLTQQSLKLYGQSLRQMQLALWDPKKMYSDDVLGACMLLTMYEVMECPSESRKGYLSHHDGCARLVQLRGPEAHMSGLGHSIFLQFRYMASLESMVSKKTYLTETVWKTVPWMKEPKSILDAYLDVFLDGLPILLDSDRLATSSNPQEQFSTGIELLKRCWKFDEELEKFYQSLKTVYSHGQLFWPVLIPETGHSRSHTDTLSSTRFEFADVKIAVTMMMYWATLTVVWSGMSHLYEMVDSIAGTIVPSITVPATSIELSQIYLLLGVPEPGHSKDFIVPARKVFQAVDFCMSNELSMRSIVAPLTMVVDCLKAWPRYEEEVKWAREKLNFVAQHGMKIVPYVSEIDTEIKELRAK